MLDLTEENRIFLSGASRLGALDEAGRGPLAGPVVAACVVCEKDFRVPEELRQVNDSKLLTEKKREELFDFIMNNFSDVGVGYCDSETIDRINILQATFLAMKKAISVLKIKPDYIILDGKMLIPNISLNQHSIIKGDSKVFSIAAASIVAKVTRDRMMKKYHDEFPEYGFDRHKGYGTKDHFNCLQKYGPCKIHRQSFEPIRSFVARKSTSNI